MPGGRRVGHLYFERGRRNRRGGFFAGRIGFSAIAEMVEETLSRMPAAEPRTIDDILEIDRESRAVARELADGAARPCPVTA